MKNLRLRSGRHIDVKGIRFAGDQRIDDRAEQNKRGDRKDHDGQRPGRTVPEKDGIHKYNSLCEAVKKRSSFCDSSREIRRKNRTGN